MRGREYGSSHIGLVITGIIIVSALLGLVFYNNFVAEKPDTSSQQSEALEVPKETATIRFDKIAYSLDYPEGWKVGNAVDRVDKTPDDDPAVKEADDETADEPERKTDQNTATITLVSPASSVEVVVRASMVREEMEPCDSSEARAIGHYAVYEDTPNEAFAANPTYLVEALYDAKDGGYEHIIGLTPDGGETNAATGQSRCNVQNVGMSGPLLQDEEDRVAQPYLSAKIVLTQYKNEPMREMQLGRDIFASDDYAQAREILESLRKE